jgi:hypothetical protein
MLGIGGIIGTRIYVLPGVPAAEYVSPVEYLFYLKL